MINLYNQSPTGTTTTVTGKALATPSDILKERIKILLMIAAIYAFLSLFGAGCPIRYTTGLTCPGCGMTRAVLSALQLNFAQAFYYHPLFLLAPIMVLLFLFDAYIKPAYVKASWFVIILLFLITYIIRLFVTHSDVVDIDISSGIVLKLFHQIIVGGSK